jgi:hypothetical protein
MKLIEVPEALSSCSIQNTEYIIIIYIIIYNYIYIHIF